MRTVGLLAVLVLALALTISRLGLVFHELVGHGGVAAAFGGDIVTWSLHAFGGGWLDYDRPRGGGIFVEYAVDTGGIAVEWLLAIGCAIASRRVKAPTLELGFEGAAWALAIHGGWYLSAGTFHGFGDGWLLHQRLGDARLALALPVGVAIVIAAYFAGLRLATRLRGFGSRGAVAAAMVLGLGGHGALAAGEHALRTDPTYTVTMRTATERAIEQTLAQREAAAQAAGQPLDAPAVAAARADLERQHQDFPYRIWLTVALGLAAAVGVARARAPASSSPPQGRTVAIAAAVAFLAIALVVILDRLSP